MKMQLSTVCATVFFLGLSACSKNDPAPSAADLGTYAGNFSVVDDPQTQLGYIANAKVTVTKSGSTATIKITGDLSFDREYTGSIISAQNNSYSISISNQTKPIQKIAGGDLQISDNKLAFSFTLANDNVSAVKSNSTQTIQITGKLILIGTNLLKQ